MRSTTKARRRDSSSFRPVHLHAANESIQAKHWWPFTWTSVPVKGSKSNQSHSILIIFLCTIPLHTGGLVEHLLHSMEEVEQQGKLWHQNCDHLLPLAAQTHNYAEILHKCHWAQQTCTRRRDFFVFCPYYIWSSFVRGWTSGDLDSTYRPVFVKQIKQRNMRPAQEKLSPV